MPNGFKDIYRYIGIYIPEALQQMNGFLTSIFVKYNSSKSTRYYSQIYDNDHILSFIEIDIDSRFIFPYTKESIILLEVGSKPLYSYYIEDIIYAVGNRDTLKTELILSSSAKEFSINSRLQISSFFRTHYTTFELLSEINANWKLIEININFNLHSYLSNEYAPVDLNYINIYLNALKLEKQNVYEYVLIYDNYLYIGDYYFKMEEFKHFIPGNNILAEIFNTIIPEAQRGKNLILTDKLLTQNPIIYEMTINSILSIAAFEVDKAILRNPKYAELITDGFSIAEQNLEIESEIDNMSTSRKYFEIDAKELRLLDEMKEGIKKYSKRKATKKQND